MVLDESSIRFKEVLQNFKQSNIYYIDSFIENKNTKIMNKRIAILATDGFEEIELTSPKAVMEKEGFDVKIVAPKSGKIKAWANGNWSDDYKVNHVVTEIAAKDFDALVLPGGVINPDKLRIDENVLDFIRDFFKQGKPVAAICHGSWTLINAGVVKGRTMTSYKSIRKDMENAGVNWVDKKVVVDNGLITSRNPGDLEAFNEKLIEEIKEGKHNKQQV